MQPASIHRQWMYVGSGSVSFTWLTKTLGTENSTGFDRRRISDGIAVVYAKKSWHFQEYNPEHIKPRKTLHQRIMEKALWCYRHERSRSNKLIVLSTRNTKTTLIVTSECMTYEDPFFWLTPGWVTCFWYLPSFFYFVKRFTAWKV